jgi:multiple sugar transport system permease protein
MALLSAKKMKKIPFYIVAVFLAGIWFIPLLYIIVTSFRLDGDVLREGYRFFPSDWTLETYKTVTENQFNAPVLRWFGNSFFISGVSAILILIIDAMAAYGYARLKFRGRTLLFGILMATIMVPGVINLIPNYQIISIFHLKNTPWAMILPSLGGVGGIFLLRQFMYTVPYDFDEAATIDGAGKWRIFIQIIMPFILPALVVVGLFTFLGSWNDFLWPLIVTNDVEKRTLTAGLSILRGVYDIEYASLMVSAVISAIPVLLIYAVAQRFLLQGIVLSSGIKG